MVEHERASRYEHVPIQAGEEQQIAQGVDELFDSTLVFLPDYPLPEAPSNLVRRFWFEKPTEGESFIPWRDLPDDIFSRASAANNCKRKIYQFNGEKQDWDTGITTLSPDDVRNIFQKEYTAYIGPSGIWRDYSIEFDLHDVYLCIEKDLIEHYDSRSHYGTGELSGAEEHANEWMIGQLEPVLSVVGQAISQETT